ncbi:MAG: DedA family protein [Pseudomonadota bacterium]|jgi:membrane protein DedA with SNARE-associated domain|nr:DedA family protein [Pseudomonadota bacterium]
MFDWIVSWVESGGYVAIALLMLLENVFPPIPSELIMPLAGFSAARGTLNIVGVVAAGTAGSLAGAFFWYWIGRAVGPDRLKAFAGRHGRWLTLEPSGIDRARAVFDRHRASALFFGRLIPTVRTMISVPAGVNRLPAAVFTLWSLLGTALWTSLLAGAGYLLQSQYERVSEWLNPVSNAILALLVIWYLYRVIRFRPH